MTDDKETDGYYEKIKNGTPSTLNYVYDLVKNATIDYIYEPVKKGANYVYEPVKKGTIDVYEPVKKGAIDYVYEPVKKGAIDYVYEPVKNGTIYTINKGKNWYQAEDESAKQRPVRKDAIDYIYEPVKNYAIDKGKNWYQEKDEFTKHPYRNVALIVAGGLILRKVGALKFIGSILMYRRQGMVLRELVGVREALGRWGRDLTRMRQLLENLVENTSKTKK